MSYTFKNGKEMLDTIKGADLYNPDTDTYVFLYSESGSIAVYDWISNEHAADMARETNAIEYWGSLLGPGGDIYDDPSDEEYDEMTMDNLDWCEANFEGVWIDIENYLEWYERRTA